MDLNQALIEKLASVFFEKYGTPHALLFAPGRINLLGEHIDYNDGYVLPAAISLGIYGCFAPAPDDTIAITASDIGETLLTTPAQIAPATGWKNYVLSVLHQFQLRGIALPGMRMVIGSDLPMGSGLSSSAALEGAISFAVNHLTGAGLTAKELALLGQAAEHDYPGVQCGIMDQFANMLGKANHIVRIDCMTQETDYLPLDLKDYALVLVYSNVQHALTGGAYNERRTQCRTGLSRLQAITGKSSFREITATDLEAIKTDVSGVIYNRCRYVTEEIQRTRLAADALQRSDMDALGKLMLQTHAGLSTLYDVSLPQLDWLVNFAAAYPGVTGARLMGGGFGGCTINLVAKSQAAAFATDVLANYWQQFGIEAKVYPVTASDGTRLIEPAG